MQSTIIPLELLTKEKYCCIICYPTCTRKQFNQRLKELARLKIEAIELAGSKHVCNFSVLGKGGVGIVVVAYKEGTKVALKIRRTDANRSTMYHEAAMLKKANELGVGPNVLVTTDNFLVMEYIKGTLLPGWIQTQNESNAKKQLQHVLGALLDQAWKLDQAGLDHGELSNARKHIIIGSKRDPCLIDFETASISRRPSNVTSLTQYLLIGSPVARLIHRKLGSSNKGRVIRTLRTYKAKRNRESFEAILKETGIL